MIKQVIVMRKDLNMRKGKMCAQAGHAVSMCMTQAAEVKNGILTIDLNKIPNLKEWWEGAYTKIVLGCNSEEELDKLYNDAVNAGLICCMVIDNGATEFNGHKTKTCFGISPDDSEKIDKVFR